MPNVLSPRDLVFRPDNMDETVPHTQVNSGSSFRLFGPFWSIPVNKRTKVFLNTYSLAISFFQSDIFIDIFMITYWHVIL